MEKEDKFTLTTKKKGKGIRVSEFLTSLGKLRVSDSALNHHLLQDKDWLVDKNQNLHHQ